MNTFLQRISTAPIRKVILFGFGLLLFLNTLPNGYNVDDTLVTMGHQLTSKGFQAIPEIFASPYYQDEMGYRYEYRPVVLTSFAIEHQLLGESARTSHLINALLFALTCMVVGNLTALLCPAGWILFPLLAGLLFAVHPMHVEAVASIKNRDEMLALLFALGSFHQALRFSKDFGTVPIISASFLMLLSLLSKTSAIPMVLVIPVALVALRAPWKKAVAVGSALFVSLGTFMLLGDWPLERLAIAAVMMTAMLVGAHALMDHRWVSKSKELLSNTGFPESHQEWNDRVWDVFRTGWPFHLIITALIALAVQQSNLALLSAPMAMLVIQVWSGRRFRTDSLVMLLMVVTAGAIMQRVDIAFYMAFAVIMAVGRYAAVPMRLLWMLLTVLMVAHTLSTVLSAEQPAFTDGLLILVPYMPLLVSVQLRRFGARIMAIPFILGTAVQVYATFNDLTYQNMVVSVFIPMTGQLSMYSGRRIGVRTMVLTLLAFAGAFALLVAQPTEPDALIRPHRVVPKPPLPDAPVLKPIQQQGQTRADRPLTFIEFPLGQDADWDHRIGTASMVLGHYMKMMFVAYPQAFYYGFDEVRIVRSNHPWAIFSIILHMSLLLLALLLARSHPVLSVGIIAYLACIFLFSNLVSPVAGMIGDRLTYVASFGFCLAIAYTIQWAYLRWPGSSKVISGATLALLLLWSGMTLARNTDWKDRVTLMTTDLEHVPRSAQAHYLLGFALMEKAAQQRDPSAMRELQKQGLQHLKTAPSIYPGYLNYWYDLGRAYRDMGDLRSALPCYKEAHRLDSTYVDAIMQVAMLSEELNDPASAQFYYERCIRINPRHLQAYTNLSFLLFKAGKLQESIAVNEKAIAENPSWRDPYDNIARTYQVMQQPDKAKIYLDRLKNLR